MNVEHRGYTVVVLKADDGLGLSYLGRLEGKGKVFCRIIMDGDLWKLSGAEMRVFTDLLKAHDAAMDYIVGKLEAMSQKAEATGASRQTVNDLLSSLEEGRND